VPATSLPGVMGRSDPRQSPGRRAAAQHSVDEVHTGCFDGYPQLPCARREIRHFLVTEILGRAELV
jgi:hypothetical protein